MSSAVHLYARFAALRPADLARWIADGLVRPKDDGVFAAIDVARIGLILDLRDILDINEEALPVVLHLCDVVYALRRELRSVGASAPSS